MRCRAVLVNVHNWLSLTFAALASLHSEMLSPQQVSHNLCDVTVCLGEGAHSGIMRWHELA